MANTPKTIPNNLIGHWCGVGCNSIIQIRERKVTKLGCLVGERFLIYKLYWMASDYFSIAWGPFVKYFVNYPNEKSVIIGWMNDCKGITLKECLRQ